MAWLVGLTGISVILGILVSPGGASPRADVPPLPNPLRIGMNSCAARGCHGAVDTVDPAKGEVYIKDGAYTTWLNFDPHASAYDVLLEDRSVEIARKLKGPLKDKPAHEADLCLSCHATTSPPEPIDPKVAPLRDGISCEACHGPAQIWNDKHLQANWRKLPANVKEKDGMADLSTPVTRAKLCVECHVGNRSRGMDMNHDLIAAGHPRLNFEFASYQAAYPKHWKEKPGTPNDFEARSWAVGQVVTLKAVIELLAARAEAAKPGAKRVDPAPEAIWPEFSEYECFACHHGLADQKGHAASKPGQLPWATWPSAMLPDLVKDPMPIGPGSNWAKLVSEMGQGVPDEDKVSTLAKEVIEPLDKLIKALEGDRFDAKRIVALRKDLASRPPLGERDWDRKAQKYLAISALDRASKDLGVAVDPEFEKALQATLKLLEFPQRYDSPRNVSKASVSNPTP